MPLTVGWFVAHVMLVALLGMGKRKDGEGFQITYSGSGRKTRTLRGVMATRSPG
jgi:hypothetical protein